MRGEGMGGSGESGKAGAMRSGMGTGGIIARTQRARYNAASRSRYEERRRGMRDSRAASGARALAAAALALAISPALAQAYPARAIHLLLPFAGGTDAVARLLAFKMSPALGEQVLPEQRLGAGGNIAHRAVAAAAPDGYTLLMAAPPFVINPLLNPTAGFDPLRDFVPIAHLTAIANVLVVQPKVAAKTLDELIAL